MPPFLLTGIRSSWAVGTLPLGMLHHEVILNRRQYYGYRIVSIVHYKEKTAIGHEFHALRVWKNGSSEVIVLRIDRRPTTRLLTSSSDTETDDSISPVDPNCDWSQFYHISTTNCSEQQPLTVLLLCEVCAFIRNAAPVYSLVRAKHCYWFCTAFLIGLRMFHFLAGDIERGPDYKRRGRCRGVKLISEDSIGRELAARAIHYPLVALQWVPSGDCAGHGGRVTDISFSPNGQHIISCSYDQTVCVWDATTGGKVRPPLEGLCTGEPELSLIAVSPDGRRIASASDDMVVRIWDLETGTPDTEPLRGHTRSMLSVAFSPDGRKIVSCSRDESVRIWDLETGAAVGEPLRGHNGTAWSVAWSLDASRIVSGSTDGTIYVWDVQTGALVGDPFRGHIDCVFSVAFSPDGSRVVSGSRDMTVRLWDIASQQALGEPLRSHTNWVRFVAFSPQGRWIASGSYDETVRIWDNASGGAAGEVAILDAGSEVWSVAWSPAGDRVAVGCWDGNIRTWRRVAD